MILDSHTDFITSYKSIRVLALGTDFATDSPSYLGRGWGLGQTGGFESELNPFRVQLSATTSHATGGRVEPQLNTYFSTERRFEIDSNPALYPSPKSIRVLALRTDFAIEERNARGSLAATAGRVKPQLNRIRVLPIATASLTADSPSHLGCEARVAVSPPVSPSRGWGLGQKRGFEPQLNTYFSTRRRFEFDSNPALYHSPKYVRVLAFGTDLGEVRRGSGGVEPQSFPARIPLNRSKLMLYSPAKPLPQIQDHFIIIKKLIGVCIWRLHPKEGWEGVLYKFLDPEFELE